jgi:hypothetical protein
MLYRCRAFFPVLAIKREHSERFYRALIQAIDIYTKPIRVRSGHIKWFAATHLAEVVFRHTRIKCITCQYRLIANQLEIGSGDYQVQKAGTHADGTVTPIRHQFLRPFNLDCDRTAMATSLVAHINTMRP